MKRREPTRMDWQGRAMLAMCAVGLAGMLYMLSMLTGVGPATPASRSFYAWAQQQGYIACHPRFQAVKSVVDESLWLSQAHVDAAIEAATIAAGLRARSVSCDAS